MNKETNELQKKADEKPQCELVAAICDIRMYRDAIAHFISDAIRWPERIVEHCDANGWNDSVAYDLREGLFKLGCVLGTLTTWESDAGLTRKQVLRIDRQIHGEVEGK